MGALPCHSSFILLSVFPSRVRGASYDFRPRNPRVDLLTIANLRGGGCRLGLCRRAGWLLALLLAAQSCPCEPTAFLGIGTGGGVERDCGCRKALQGFPGRMWNWESTEGKS